MKKKILQLLLFSQRTEKRKKPSDIARMSDNMGQKGVYAILIDGELAYIGLTTRTFKQRWKEHLGCGDNPERKSSQQPYLYNAMRNAKSIEFKGIVVAPNGATTRDIEMIEYGLITALQPKYNYLGIKKPYKFSDKDITPYL